MHADGVYMIGKTHSVCQDYVVTNNSYVILSDGCSTSPDTDIGSRLLVKAAEHHIQSNPNPETLHQEAARLALDWARALGLAPQTIDATLLTAFRSGEDLIVSCSGDGVIVTETISGIREIYEISYPAGYPFYPAYLHQPDRLATLIQAGSSTKDIKQYSSAGLSGIRHCDRPIHVMRLSAKDFRFVALISDGVRSFFTTANKSVESVSWSNVIPELMSFKSWNGAFVARRVNRFMKDCQAKDWHHADDLSMGVLYLGS